MIPFWQQLLSNHYGYKLFIVFMSIIMVELKGQMNKISLLIM